MTADKNFRRKPDEFEDRTEEAAQKMRFQKPAQHKGSVTRATELI